ncbi:hypothetical protein FOA52_004825 [Chlamydomonas sp. UWO 241]|nr:hypothetical protein FOA52_004825 [Chlamydomonas sp. UWO 241]
MLAGHRQCGRVGCSGRTHKNAPALRPAAPSVRPTVLCRAEDAPVMTSEKAAVAAVMEVPTEVLPTPAKKVTTKGLWTRCEKCGVILYIKHLRESSHICFGCGHHLRMSAQERIDSMIDAGTWRPIDETLSPGDPLEFNDLKPYVDRVVDSQKKTGMQDGVVCGTGMLHGAPVALGVMEFAFMGGSMGSVVGEKLTRLIEYATQEGLALIIVCSSGGARMQEGIFSLMQMAKISGALHVHQNEAKLLYVAVLASPTTGGVTASFGMLGDIIVSEPGAIIGFAGRRVIEQTLNEQLPDDFQTAEYLLDKGLLDIVVPRTFMKGAIFEMMNFYRAAPYKEQGRIPFGVQHGVFLSTEEKVRRKYAEWKASSSSSNGTGTAELSASGARPSYQELVSSVRTLLAEEEVNVKDLVGSDADLHDTLKTAQGGRIEWLQHQASLLGAKEPAYTFRQMASGNGPSQDRTQPGVGARAE